MVWTRNSGHETDKVCWTVKFSFFWHYLGICHGVVLKLRSARPLCLRWAGGLILVSLPQWCRQVENTWIIYMTHVSPLFRSHQHHEFPDYSNSSKHFYILSWHVYSKRSSSSLITVYQRQVGAVIFALCPIAQRTYHAPLLDLETMTRSYEFP